MKNKEKLYSIVLASTTLVLFFLISVSFVASASIVIRPSTINGTQITSGLIPSEPAIYGDRIVWADYRNTAVDDQNWDIYMYNLSTQEETQITTNESGQSNPAIYGNSIIWQDNRNGNYDIYMYDLSTSKETQITTNESDQMNPEIYGDKIVWIDERNGNENTDIYMYDLSTSRETRITTSGSAGGPAIYCNRIAWVDWCNDDNYSKTGIYMGTLSLNFSIANFSASSTCGKEPLKVSFTDESTESPISWEWNFGDGTNSTEQNPEHTYSTAGNYTVTLKASNANGTDTKTKTNYINVKKECAVSTAYSTAYISDLNLKGEWVKITNKGMTAVNMKGWKITDKGGNHEYAFPSYNLKSNSTVTLYTGRGKNNSTELFWGMLRNVWNDAGDTAYLYNTQGQTVSTFFKDNHSLNPIPPTNQVITEVDNGKTINLKDGDIFYLKLQENPSTGYSWELNLSQGLSLLTDKYYSPGSSEEIERPIIGTEGIHLWEIKALTEGNQQLKGIYKRSWENVTGEELNFTLNVEVV